MILVDVYVAALNKTCDFKLDESVSVCAVIVDIVEILLRETKDYKDDQEIGKGYDLCSYEYGVILPKDKSLLECGICNGSKLLLV